MIRSLATCVVLFLLAFAASAQESGRVKFTLDWVIDGQQTPFLLTQGRGYFTQHGLNVTLDAGTGSSAAVQRVASGTYDMGYGDTSALIEHLARNPDPALRVQAIYMTQDATPAGILTLRKHNIASPKDLVGRTIGGPVFDSARKLFPIFAHAQGFDATSVKWQNLQPGLNLTQLVRGQLDAASGFPLFQVGNMEALGVKADELVLLNYKDFGVNIYGNAVLVNPKFMQQNPKTVAAFLRAYNQGVKDTIANPDEAIKYVQQREATINPAVELSRLKALIQFIATPNARASGLGTGEKSRIQRQSDDVARAFGLDKAPEADHIFTPAFLPPRAERSL
ncbi:MAG TPA: ABC transporter substrate-binding protein [Burkholderiales bacterium]|nr:ABC transporter substrate-binding protein [Burkholderiales bacterium]